MTPNLHPYNVTVTPFDPAKGLQDPSAEHFILPVDSPDEEHAISAAMSNAVAFTPKLNKLQTTTPRPIAFLCTAIVPRS